MLIDMKKLTGTASSGSLAVNTPSSMHGFLHHVVVNPATSTTIYDVKITNSESINIYERVSETGTLSEEVQLPIRGTYTITISNATVDEAFTIQLGIDEA